MENAIFDTTGAPLASAYNHRDAPPGTAVQERNNCDTREPRGHWTLRRVCHVRQTKLLRQRSYYISVDQIVKATLSRPIIFTTIIITDENNRYHLAHPRVSDSRKWVAPMRAMEDIIISKELLPEQLTTKAIPEEDPPGSAAPRAPPRASSE